MEKEILPGENDIYGLVLTGGQSSRMGQDKSQIYWQGKTAVKRAFDLLSSLCQSTFVSIRKGQQVISEFPYLTDIFDRIGPMGGIVTALKIHPQKSWLVLAVDQLMIDSKVLQYLIAQRDKEAQITLFKDKQNILQPLCALYEPGILPVLENAVSQGQFALHRAIQQTKYHPIEWMGDPNVFININTQRDLDKLRNL